MRLSYLAMDPDRHGELTEEELVELYRHPLPDGKPVHLRTNFVTSLDGSITGPDGRGGSITTPSDQQVFALHRALADVVLVGAGTARTEGYRAVRPQPWQSALRRDHGLPAAPALVIVSNSLNVDPAVAEPREGGSGGPVLIVTRQGAGDHDPFLATGVEVVELGEHEVDLPATVDLLGERGWPRVLCEGGPWLHRDLLAANLVDEISLSLAPVVVGGPGPRTTAGDPLPAPPGFRPRLVIVADDGTVFTSYRRA